MTRLCIAGGGTGGHVFPAIHLARLCRKKWPDIDVEFVGAKRGLEAKILPALGEKATLLTMHGIKGADIGQKVRVLFFELPMAVFKLLRRWSSCPPRLVVGVGGYASIAAVTAALIKRIPVVLYEQNAVAGLVNRLFAPFCQRIMLGFATAGERLPRGKTVHTGNLTHPGLAHIAWRAHTPPRLLVLGGSQGAAFLNRLVPSAARRLKEKGIRFTVAHVAGSLAAADEVAKAYRAAGIEANVIDFCHDMAAFYASGDLLIARSGAMTVTEAARVGMPAIFIPLPHSADDHQWKNASVLADAGGAIVLKQENLSSEMLADRLAALLCDPIRLQAMSDAASSVAVEDADQRQLFVLAPLLGKAT